MVDTHAVTLPPGPPADSGLLSNAGYWPRMGITATIMNIATGRPIQTMTFGRMPKPWATFNLATGELVTAQRVDVGKPAPGRLVASVDVWVTVADR